MPRRRNHVFSLETLERRDCPAGFTLTPLNQIVSEGNSADFELTLDAVSQVPESVIVTSKSGTAIIGSDFMQRTERITFFPGETTKNFSVQTLRDPVESIEGAENFSVIVKPLGGTPSEISSFVVINDYVPPLNFQIDFVFNADVPESLVTASGLAANLWQSVITENLPEVTSGIFGTIDDIQINVQLGLLSGDSDGDGNTLAQGQPLLFRTDSTGLPYLAQIGVDEADISNPALSTIMAHEIGHCLGFPTSRGWENNVIPLGSDAPTNFTGPKAVEQYNLLFGTAAVAAGVPIEQDGGDGTAFAHWDDATFGNELMTGTLDFTSTNPLSVITVGAFDDMGYGVNYDAAQPYSPPTTTVTTIGAGISNTLGRGISNAVATIPAVIPPTTITQTTISTSKRVLPARITFPDRPSIILSENNASRQMVRSALEINSGLHEGVIAFSLHHLSTKQRSILAAWASIGQETQSFTSSSMTSAGHGPRPGFFANEIFHIDVHGNLL
ncbi:MAG: hypothetical protein HN703_12975 [Planctomycetaceae bacterium]|jgi:hypothetical protein|nr:hypothetical protein [Planctomycetaceae bacterium]